MTNLPVSREDAVRGVGMSIVLTIVTCGLYNLYWNYKEMQTFNGLLGREEFNFGMWFLLTLVTCGLYHIYYEYKMGIAVVELQKKYGTPPDENLPIISLVLSILGFSIVVDAIQQNEINKIYAKNA